MGTFELSFLPRLMTWKEESKLVLILSNRITVSMRKMLSVTGFLVVGLEGIEVPPRRPNRCFLWGDFKNIVYVEKIRDVHLERERENHCRHGDCYSWYVCAKIFTET